MKLYKLIPFLIGIITLLIVFGCENESNSSATKHEENLIFITASSAKTNEKGDKIHVTLSDDITKNTASVSNFTVSQTNTSPSIVNISFDKTSLILHLDELILVPDSSVILNYTKSTGSVTNKENHSLQSFSNLEVTNSVLTLYDATTIGGISSVIAIADNEDSFDALNGAVSLDTVVINHKTYAVIAAKYEGVQIIDITNPASPISVASMFDNTVTALDGAIGVSIVEIATSYYAIVVSQYDGLQIINITNPNYPSSVAAITHSDNGFAMLQGAVGVDTVKIDSNTYAIVTSSHNNGVQIIDITAPGTPTASATIAEDIDGFTALNGSQGITTVKIGSNTYAIVASKNDGVQIIDITTPSTPTPVAAIIDDANGFTTLDGANGITTVEIGSNIYAIVASQSDNGVQIIDITNPKVPTAVTAIIDGVNGFTTLGGANGITTVKVGSSTYAIVASQSDDGAQIIDITNPSIPTAVAGANNFTALNKASDVKSVKAGSNTYAIVTSLKGGIQIISLDSSILFTSIETNLSGNQLIVIFNDIVTADSVTMSDFTVFGANSTPSVNSISTNKNKLILDLDKSIQSNETITLSYTRTSGTIKNSISLLLSNFNKKDVTNNVN